MNNTKSAHHFIHKIIKSIGPKNIIILVCAIFTGKYHTLCGDNMYSHVFWYSNSHPPVLAIIHCSNIVLATIY